MYIEKTPTQLTKAEYEARARHARSEAFHAGLGAITRIFRKRSQAKT